MDIVLPDGLFVEEVLWTKKPGEALHAHVVIGQTPPPGWDGPPKLAQAMRPDQVLEKYGIDISQCVSHLQQEALKENAALREANAKGAQELETMYVAYGRLLQLCADLTGQPAEVIQSLLPPLTPPAPSEGQGEGGGEG